MDMAIRAAIDGIGLAFSLEEYVGRTSRAVHSCASLRIGVLRSLGSSSITQAGGSNPRR